VWYFWHAQHKGGCVACLTPGRRTQPRKEKDVVVVVVCVCVCVCVCV